MFFSLLRRIERRISGCISLRTKREKRGDVLVSYTSTPFIYGKHILESHEAYWYSFSIIQILLRLGYDVDVIDWDNNRFFPHKSYTAMLDIHGNMDRLQPYLSPDCKKILHLTTSYWEVNNSRSQQRARDLESRRGVYIEPKRNLQPSNSIYIADHVALLGNQVTRDTYPKIEKDIRMFPQATALQVPFYRRDMNIASKQFLWIGGSGMVHKGLDLVLEVFKDLPDYTLSIFGNVEAESDFARVYKKELYQLPNIKCYGKVSLQGEVFQRVVNSCLGLVYPSCAEGSSGAVTNCMHQGLIPLISAASGVDVSDPQSILHDASIEGIREKILHVSAMPKDILLNWSYKTWKYANEHYTRPIFLEKYEYFLTHVVGL